MTTPFENFESNTEARRIWWARYLTVQNRYDTKIRTALKDAADDAQERINTLASKSTFSAAVRTAQLRLAMQELKDTHKTLFGSLLPIIKSGQKDEADAAFDGLTETDKSYIYAAVSEIHDAESYLKSARQTALNNVTAVVQRITQSELPLSHRIYRTESLANRWVSNVINRSLARGDSAKDLAQSVRKHILPTTPGGTSYAALRLGRTELNNAFHATAIVSAQDRPWITGMRWYTSDTHTHDPSEICTQLNGQVFDPTSVPKKPHPQCRCFVAPEVESLAVFKQNLTAGVYRDWMTNAA